MESNLLDFGSIPGVYDEIIKDWMEGRVRGVIKKGRWMGYSGRGFEWENLFLLLLLLLVMKGC